MCRRHREPGDRTIVVAFPVANAMAGAVEGGERQDHGIGHSLGGFGTRTERAETGGNQQRARDPLAEAEHLGIGNDGKGDRDASDAQRIEVAADRLRCGSANSRKR